jgi:hypothetical protein
LYVDFSALNFEDFHVTVFALHNSMQTAPSISIVMIETLTRIGLPTKYLSLCGHAKVMTLELNFILNVMVD